MVNRNQLKILKQGVKVWNKWRKENPDVEISLIKADLREADLRKADLRKAFLLEADFRDANLSGANLDAAHLLGANLRNSDFRKADLVGAYLGGADVSEANLEEVNLHHANLIGTHFNGSNLMGANLRRAELLMTNFSGANLRRAKFEGANLFLTNLTGTDLREAVFFGATLLHTNVDKANASGSLVHGINVWSLEGDFEEQNDLIITGEGEPIITVDNVEVAQFVYLILNNEKIRDVINTITSKSVLILGRFSIAKRKAILHGLRKKLREYNLLPIVFDFDCPTDKDFTETIKTLAGLCYFVIADVTNPKSSPLELQATVPDYQIPFVPIIQEGESPFAMMVDLQKKYNWVLNTVTYDSIETLMKVLKPLIIDPAMKKRQELRLIKAQVPEVISGKDFLKRAKNEKQHQTTGNRSVSR